MFPNVNAVVGGLGEKSMRIKFRFRRNEMNIRLDCEQCAKMHYNIGIQLTQYALIANMEMTF